MENNEKIIDMNCTFNTICLILSYNKVISSALKMIKNRKKVNI